MKTKQVILGSRDSYGRYEVKKTTKKQKKNPTTNAKTVNVQSKKNNSYTIKPDCE